MTFINATRAVKRGRPVAANDNAAAYAERSAVIRGLRELKLTFREIADRLEIGIATTYEAIHGRPAKRRPIAANDNTVRRHVANNGGCSTTSGMVGVTLARVPTLERPEIQVAA